MLKYTNSSEVSLRLCNVNKGKELPKASFLPENIPDRLYPWQFKDSLTKPSSSLEGSHIWKN